MSYDVGFYTREKSALPSVDALDAFFRGRPHYKVESGSARYGNPLTGVDFEFDYGSHRDEDGWEPIRLSAATGAPHTRALELVEEVEALVRAFDLEANDPQMDGMGKGPFDRDAFERGCLKASRFGLAVQIGMNGATPALYDDERLTAHWRWNRAHEATSRSFTDEIFVPSIAYMASGDGVLATVTWTGDMPFVLPDVDAIVTIDKSGGGASLKVIPVSAIEGALKDVGFAGAPARHRVVNPLPAGLIDAVAKAKPIAPAPKAVALWSVLGRAFLDLAWKDFPAWAPKKKAAGKPKAKKPAAKKANKTKKAAPKKKTVAKKAAAKPNTKAKNKAKAKPAKTRRR